jgi:hypothetical protein
MAANVCEYFYIEVQYVAKISTPLSGICSSEQYVLGGLC